MSLPDDLSVYPPEHLAGMLEAAKDAAKAARSVVDRHNAEAVVIEAYLMRALGDGEAVQAPSGRILFKEAGALGAAKVNEAAIDEWGTDIHPDLQPVTRRVYPGVTAIRSAAKSGDLPKGTTAEDFLIPAPSGSVLRWRTLPGMEAAA